MGRGKEETARMPHNVESWIRLCHTEAYVKTQFSLVVSK